MNFQAFLQCFFPEISLGIFKEISFRDFFQRSIRGCVSNDFFYKFLYEFTEILLKVCSSNSLGNSLEIYVGNTEEISLKISFVDSCGYFSRILLEFYPFSKNSCFICSSNFSIDFYNLRISSDDSEEVAPQRMTHCRNQLRHAGKDITLC